MAADIQRQVQVYIDALNTTLLKLQDRFKLQSIAPLQKITELSGVQPIYVLLAVSVIALITISFTIGIAAIVNIIGFIPVLETFTALSQGGSKLEKDVWLTYWMLYDTFFLLESLELNLLNTGFYQPIKLALLIWLFNPTTRGAAAVYSSVFKPIAEKLFPEKPATT